MMIYQSASLALYLEV